MEKQIVLTKHCEERFRERVAKSKRAKETILNAYMMGKPIREAKIRGRYKKSLELKSEEYEAEARIYKNVVFWFRGNIALTLYQVPKAEIIK